MRLIERMNRTVARRVAFLPLFSAVVLTVGCPVVPQPSAMTTSFTLTLNVEGEGTVEPTSGSFDAGTEVSLTATPAPGWAFSRWEGDASDEANPLTITIDGDTTITAVFTSEAEPERPAPAEDEEEPVEVQLIVTVEGNGHVDLDPPGGIYEVGTDVTATAIPDSGWQFDEWLGDVTGTNSPLSLTLIEDTELTATFSISSSGGGGP